MELELELLRGVVVEKHSGDAEQEPLLLEASQSWQLGFGLDSETKIPLMSHNHRIKEAEKSLQGLSPTPSTPH